MYVGVPKNYSGTAFQRERPIEKPKEVKAEKRDMFPPTLPHSVQKTETDVRPQKRCAEADKNPLSCLINAFRSSSDGGITAEDLLLICLIVLLLGKKGNEDIVFILAMLLLF